MAVGEEMMAGERSVDKQSGPTARIKRIWTEASFLLMSALARQIADDVFLLDPPSASALLLVLPRPTARGHRCRPPPIPVQPPTLL